MAKKNPTRIIVLGGGFAGTSALRRLHHKLHNRTDVEILLVSRENHFLFTPLLHEVATGSIAPSNIIEPLRGITQCCMVNFCEAEVQKVDCDARVVATSRGAFSYEYAVIALGAETNDYGTPGVAEFCFTLKSLSAAVRLKNLIIECLESAACEPDQQERQRLLTFVAVGGGATGVELAAELSEFVYGSLERFYGDHRFFGDVKIIVLQKGNELLLPFTPASRAASLKALQRKRVDVRFGVSASSVTADGVHCASGEIISTATPIWVAGVRPSPITLDGDISRDPSGRIVVLETMQLPDYPMVFALGDVAACPGVDGKALPQLAQVADRQGSKAADNIVRLITGQDPLPFRYHHRGSLVSVGHWMAIAELPGIAFRGRFAWLLWRTIYLTKLLTWSKRIQVAVDWIIGLFLPRDISKWE